MTWMTNLPLIRRIWYRYRMLWATGHRLTDWDWDRFIQHNMTLYRCLISDIHDNCYVLFSTNLISNTSLHVGRPLLRPFLVASAEATLARQKKDSATNEKWWHHFRILIANKWSVVWNECKNREFLLTGWKSLWSLATWLVISDRYIGEVILQLSIEAMVSHSNSTKPLPQLRNEYINNNIVIKNTLCMFPFRYCL